MNWQAIGAIGEILGAIAVVLTLIYLALQFRGMKAQINNDALGQVQAADHNLVLMMLENAELMSKANGDPELSAVERYKLQQILDAHVSRRFHHYLQTVVVQANAKVPPRTLADTLRSNPALLEIWKEQERSKDRVVREFQESVDDFLERT